MSTAADQDELDAEQEMRHRRQWRVFFAGCVLWGVALLGAYAALAVWWSR